MTPDARFSISVEIKAPVDRVFEVMADTGRWHRAPGIRVIALHSAEAIGSGSRVTLSLRYEGLLAKLLARLTRNLTNRYLAMEASGLKSRSENPFYRHAA